jgi:integrase
MVATLVPFDESVSGWERALYAFLAEKERRSGSRRTVEGYSRMLQQFFGSVGKPPERVTSPEVFASAHGVGLSGRQPSAVTIGARMACVSFYRFLIRMGLVASNPCDQLERPRVSPSPPRGLSAEDIRRLLAAIADTPVGLQDRAIILTLTLTGRRRAEVLGMKASDISCDNGTPYYCVNSIGTTRLELREQTPGSRPCRGALVAPLAGRRFVLSVPGASRGLHSTPELRMASVVKRALAWIPTRNNFRSTWQPFTFLETIRRNCWQPTAPWEQRTTKSRSARGA